MKTLRIKRIYFNQIASKKKILEARVSYPDIRDIKVGQQLRFECEYDSLVRTVISIRKYKTIEEMLNLEMINSLLPGYSKTEARDAYNSIYSSDKIEQHGGLIVLELS